MICMNCGSERVLGVTGKCSDRTGFKIGEIDKSGGYVPNDMNIGGGDYLEFDLCLDCGHVNGDWPCPTTEIEEAEQSEDW